MRVVNGNGDDAYRDFVSGAMAQERCGFDAVRRLHGAGERATLGAPFAILLIAMQQRFSDAAVPDGFVTEMAGDFFSAVAPEDDSFLQVHDAEANRQAFENAAIDLGIGEEGH